MKKLRIATIVVIPFMMLSGCMVAKDGHTYIDGHCVTCLNNPITGEAYNYSKTSPDYLNAKQYQIDQGYVSTQPLPIKEGQVLLSVKTPIDKAYVRLKREFGFFTRRERVRGMRHKNSAWIDLAGEFRYEALPGVSYHMRESTWHTFHGMKNRHIIDALLETNGHGTDITLTYWVRKPQLKSSAYRQSIKARALQALR